jgi:putative transcriptional regulator
MKMNRIKEVITQKGVSQREIARTLGLSANGVNIICQNKSQPNIDTLFKIARALNVQPSELLVTVDWSNFPMENEPSAVASSE